MSPLLDGIARDNTNDGDGWDVRLHHFTGLEDHGYPTLYKNFPDEQIAPLADYGGGSGCGGLWLDEPGIPAKWNGAPLTVDWGREAIFRHALTPKGATFTAGQEQFVKIPRATDIDVDAQSRLYVTSWRGGKFNYIGPDIGYLARLTPKGYVPPPVPVFAKLGAPELVKLFTSRKLAHPSRGATRAVESRCATGVPRAGSARGDQVAAARVARARGVHVEAGARRGRAGGVGEAGAANPRSRRGRFARWRITKGSSRAFPRSRCSPD